MNLLKNKINFSLQIINYFLTANFFLICCFFSLSFITKYESSIGTFSVTNIEEHCHYLFKSNIALKNKKLQKLIINNFNIIDLEEETFTIQENNILLQRIIICPNILTYQPAILIYGEETLLHYLWSMLIN